MPDQHVAAAHAIPHKRTSRLFGQYIIKHRFQFKFSFVIFIFLAVAAFTIWFEGRWAVGRMVTSGLISNDEAIQHFSYLNQLVAYTGCLALAVTFLLSLFFSHFVAGPIYRFEKTLEEMRNGNLTMFVKLRKRDEFKETAELFNQALSSLRFKVQKERESISAAAEKIKAFAEQMRQSGRAKEAAELDQLLFDIKNNPPQLKI